MKHPSLLVALICLFIVSCNLKNNDSVISTKNEHSVSSTPTEKSVKKSSTSNNSYPTKLPKRTSSLNTSRMTNEVDHTFPFDIELKDANGETFKSNDIFKNNGKPTVLMFWLTTCGPCHMKLKAIKPLYPKWKEEAEFNMYAISGDFQKNYASFVKQTKQKDWDWDTYNDWNREFRIVLPGKLNGYPQTFIFDKNGKLVYQDKKYRPGDEHKLFEKIKEICNS